MHTQADTGSATPTALPAACCGDMGCEAVLRYLHLCSLFCLFFVSGFLATMYISGCLLWGFIIFPSYFLLHIFLLYFVVLVLWELIFFLSLFLQCILL